MELGEPFQVGLASLGSPRKPSQHGKGHPRRTGGDGQGTVVALGTHVQQDEGGRVHPSVLLQFLGMALQINLHLPRAFPELSSLTRLWGRFCVLPSHCGLGCPLLASGTAYTVSPVPLSWPWPGIRSLNPLGFPFPTSGVPSRLPHGQHGTFGIMRHQHWHGISTDNGPCLERSFPAQEHHYPGIGAEM